MLDACANGRKHARLGVSVGRRAGNAVVRNRWKRRLREIFRTSASLRTAPIDLVITVNPGTTPASYHALEAEVLRGGAVLLRRLVPR